jgi:hypothetical protein
MFELEERRCVCGCEKTYRVLKTSAQRYYSKNHEYIHGNVDSKQKHTDWIRRTTIGNVNREKLLKVCRELRAGGASVDTMVEALNRAGLHTPTGKKWKRNNLYVYLLSCGVVTVKKRKAGVED